MKHAQSLPLSSIRLTDGVPQRMQRLVREKVLPYQWEVLHDRVEGAANVQAAIEEAHQIFTVEADEDVPHEKYEEQCLDCKEVK